jgi:hypothetical protein
MAVEPAFPPRPTIPMRKCIGPFDWADKTGTEDFEEDHECNSGLLGLTAASSQMPGLGRFNRRASRWSDSAKGVLRQLIEESGFSFWKVSFPIDGVIPMCSVSNALIFDADHFELLTMLAAHALPNRKPPEP